MFYSTLLYTTLLYPTLFYSTLLYSILLYCTLFYSTLFYSTLRYSILLYSTLFYSILLYSILLYYTLLATGRPTRTGSLKIAHTTGQNVCSKRGQLICFTALWPPYERPTDFHHVTYCKFLWLK